jgi:small subunit ribosomal protein S10|mmetsp:Transcript_30975/g.50941  ORF Transcript_30975/g.50941 Transcript_30975/m.50941 type:complete len:214 (-) Transcript_30975:937-1578(-)|eukprot:CAMPEP_0174284324 /NCGR_PEP_ID=MMETSP0809-20121228/5082_1 /TAXON_ID=73025 ORGANISM="Eutreptiella gymnastica-like, Strain CCMP1594" /NCGR_SAMPLE_ID=MMETSP0809 /ASSEMBLY_ACC=CAM_ASM_000658 /LENGTH=213 /DNA_ID=CAMNT_0015379797 /DNA_START=48 /DNA_END=689 /DNA_ORIENTATION=+
MYQYEQLQPHNNRWTVTQNSAVAIALSVASVVLFAVAGLGAAPTFLRIASSAPGVGVQKMGSLIPAQAQRMMYGVALRAATEEVAEEAAPAEAPVLEDMPELEEDVAADDSPKERIRMKLKSYKVPLLESATEQIMQACRASEAVARGPVRLPTKKKIFCVLRSPHVNKDSREHFEIRTHQRLIDVRNPTSQVIDSLMALDLPAGVDVEVKLT